MIQASLNETVPLRILAADGRTDLYAQIRVYNAIGTLVQSLSAPHLAEGVYATTWTPNIEGYYSLVGQFYFDSMFTADAGYEKTGDLVDVSTIKSNILRILGLQHENTVVDQQVYDVDQNLISARVRCYDSKANALSAGATGLRFTYTVTAEYSGGLLSNYTMVRDS